VKEPVSVLISKAPDDPDEKKEWAHGLMRLQIAMWLPASCEECGKPYESVDDFLARNPRAASDGEISFVDDACWPEFSRKPAARRKGEK